MWGRSLIEGSGDALPDSAEFPVQAAIDAASDMVFITDDTSPDEGGPLIVYANAAMAREFGYEAGELLGKSPAFAFGARTDRGTIARIREAMATMRDADGEFRAYRRDGSSFWTDWRGRGILDPLTHRKRWIAIGRNTDERRRAEDSLTILSTAIENGNDAVFVYGLRSDEPLPRMRYVNAAGLRHSGYTEEELLAGASRRGPLTEPTLVDAVLHEMTAGRSMDRRLCLYRKDGSSYWAAVHFQPVRDRSGGYSQWICIERDITADIEREQARTDLMAMIGHDLRNPLTSILGYSEMLLEMLPPGEEQTAVQQIRAAGRRLESLAFELLTISRMERNAYEPFIEDVDVIALLRDVIAYMPGGERIRVTAPPSLVMQSDASAIRHAFENLLSNALKFSSPPAKVTVDLAATAEGMRARVKDTGIGIPSADLPRVFDPSMRGANVGARRGTGLGLSFVKRLVDSLGGAVTVTSVEGRGSTFEVRLPHATDASTSSA